MHRPHSITWTTHTEEATTLLEATRLQEALLYTALHYTYMCNIVTEFYLYSIVYIYLINGRLDVTTSVRHHFRTTRTLSDTNIQLKAFRKQAAEELKFNPFFHNFSQVKSQRGWS